MTKDLHCVDVVYHDETTKKIRERNLESWNFPSDLAGSAGARRRHIIITTFSFVLLASLLPSYPKHLSTMSMPTNLYELFIDSILWLLWAILNWVDIVLVAVTDVYNAVFSRRPPSNGTKPRVVIVGASFAGLATLRELASHSNELDITIVDYKTYFEYTPGVLRCFIDPSYFSKNLTVPLSILQKSGTKVITGEVVSVEVEDSSNVDRNEVTLKDGRKIPYDYLVLAAGSTYPAAIKATPAQRTIAERQQQWNVAADELEKAQTVGIVGAGAVGVELAGEIRDKYPTKRIMLFDMAPTILPGLEPASIRYATKWLKDNHVELYLGSPLKKIDPKFIKFAEGTTVQVDVVYKCLGVAPNSTILQSGGSLTKSLEGPKKAVVVIDSLQVVGHSHVFCAGDLCFHGKSNDLKLAHTAELNAHVVADNIVRMASSDTKQQNGHSQNGASTIPLLLTYPEGVVGSSTTPKIYCLSLGKYDATLGFNQLVINGSIGAIMKWLIEWTSVAAAAQRPVGNVFWAIAHFSSNLLGRTVLPSTPAKDKTS